MLSKESESVLSPLTPTTPKFPRTFAPNRFRRGTKYTSSDAPSDVTTDAASDVTSEATTATLDAKSVHANVFGTPADSVARDRQVTSVHFFGDGRKTRRAFEWMSVSVVSDDENPFDKRLLLVDNK